MEQEDMMIVAINYMNSAGDYLEQFYTFKAIRLMLFFYSILLFIAIVLILYRLIKLSYLVVLTTGQSLPVSKGKMQKKWEKDIERVASSDSRDWKIAVLDSASLLNEVLGYAGYKGDKLGDKLSVLLPGQLDDFDKIINANNIKNKIVQDPEFEISQEEAKRLVELFGKGLRSFNAID